MKAVLSFWSKPSEKNGGIKLDKCRWSNALMHLCGWIISVNQSKNLYGKVELVTDDRGARALCDGLELPFTSVRTDLNSIADITPSLWMMGKIKAYSIQDEPFFHQDSDVFLWKKFDSKILHAPMFAQSIENKDTTILFGEVYDVYLAHMKNHGLSLGPYLEHAEMAYNVGVFGGQDTENIKKYAHEILDIVRRNAHHWPVLDRKIGGLAHCNATLEQLLLYNFAIENGIKFECVLDKFHTEDDAEKIGYTHLMSAKNAIGSEEMRDKIKLFAQKKFPFHFEKAEKWIRDGGFV